MSSRFDPYSAPSGNSWMPRSEMYGAPHGMDGYRGPAGTLMAPPPSGRAAAMSGDFETSFARELLQLYNKDPAAFDAYARNPEVRRSLNVQAELGGAVHSRDDSYLKTPRGYVLEQRLQPR